MDSITSWNRETLEIGLATLRVVDEMARMRRLATFEHRHRADIAKREAQRLQKMDSLESNAEFVSVLSAMRTSSVELLILLGHDAAHFNESWTELMSGIHRYPRFPETFNPDLGRHLSVKTLGNGSTAVSVQ